jgi:hypothetical protein
LAVLRFRAGLITTKSEKGADMSDPFVLMLNTERYRLLLANEKDPKRRGLLEKLIAETEAELRNAEFVASGERR